MRKGISLSIQTIVILSISILVLIVLVIFFTGSGRTLIGGMSSFISGTEANMTDVGQQTKDFMLGNYT